MTPPTAGELHAATESLAFQVRRVPTVRGYAGAVSSLDDQRARALGAFARLHKRLERAGKPFDLDQIQTLSEACGFFFARHRREAWRAYCAHNARPIFDFKWPSLNALLFRLCQES